MFQTSVDPASGFGAWSRSDSLHNGHGIPAPPQSQALSLSAASHGRSSWFSQTQKQSSQDGHFTKRHPLPISFAARNVVSVNLFQCCQSNPKSKPLPQRQPMKLAVGQIHQWSINMIPHHIRITRLELDFDHVAASFSHGSCPPSRAALARRALPPPAPLPLSHAICAPFLPSE